MVSKRLLKQGVLVKRTVPAENFLATMSVNVDNEKLSDAEFRAFIRRSMPIVQYPRRETAQTTDILQLARMIQPNTVLWWACANGDVIPVTCIKEDGTATYSVQTNDGKMYGSVPIETILGIEAPDGRYVVGEVDREREIVVDVNDNNEKIEAARAKFLELEGAAQKKDVHTEHCCVVHGCKYGDEDCPVVNKTKTQSYRCEGCHADGIDPTKAATDPRYPYTHASDFLRMEVASNCTTLLSRAEASQIRQVFSAVLGMRDDVLAMKLASAYLAKNK